MKRRPALLLAILLYVTLDLSLPAMPGAFVFEPAESVEGTQTRTRSAVETVALPAPARDVFLLFQLPLATKDRLVPAPAVERHRSPVATWRPRALFDPAPPSEDPH